MVKCHLEFTEFSKFCQELIGNLYGSDDFSDIALMGDDNRQFKAHKFVLRAHSNVIRDVLASSTDIEKPLLFFKGFNSHDIQFLLDFMYLGETCCEPKNVNVFFKTGKFLQIRQLVEECEDDVETLNERFSLEVLDQFCDIVGDSKVKAEEINQMEILPLENEVEFSEEVGNKEKEISVELQFGENENVQTVANKRKTFNEAEISEEVGNQKKGISEEFQFCENKNFQIVSNKRKTPKEVTEKQLSKETEQSSKATLKIQKVVVGLYNSVMESFNKADSSKEWKTLDETKIQDLNKNMCKFFLCLVKSDGSSYSGVSIRTYFQAIVKHLRKTKNVNIRKDERFTKVLETVNKRAMEADQQGLNKSSAFREEDIQRAFMSGTIGRGSPETLVTLIVYNLMMDFGCKTIEEIQEIRNRDINFGPLNDQSKPQFIQLYCNLLKTLF